ncbi:protein kinase [Streptomyces sp. AV19]|uniref:protein kinase n=1 Tax=Streptomyces sp. AV19 TaxID=2793068 RepID=UPI0018FF0771|nr:protein kinase [Streptomyces sp. AV19]MBH1938362.1 protein kinase [Streptomyces sp. AV19]MDG4535012.1 protein kinase [Streptomyces sp. AV19]
MTELPDGHFRALIRPYTGEVDQVHVPKQGFTTDFAAVIDSEKGSFFVKAMFNRPGGRRDSILRERAINPYVQPLSPRVLWSVDGDDAGWIILGFEVIDGRDLDFEPDSPDLHIAVGLLNRAASLELPDVARDWREDRWDAYVRSEDELTFFRGDALLHTDINPSNTMVGDAGAWLIDWSWPTRGAAFIDPACFVVQLISAGHSPESAEGWAARCTAWENADPKAIDAFAAADLRMHRAIADRRPDEAWLTAMAEAAQAWADHRGIPEVGP